MKQLIIFRFTFTKYKFILIFFALGLCEKHGVFRHEN